MQIARGEKLSRLSRISLQSQRFSSDFFLSIIKCFKLLYNHETFPANNKKDHTSAKLSHRKRFALYSSYMVSLTVFYFGGCNDCQVKNKAIHTAVISIQCLNPLT